MQFTDTILPFLLYFLNMSAFEMVS